MHLEKNSEEAEIQQNINNLVWRLQSIAGQIDDYNNSNTPEKAFHLLYDEVASLSVEIASAKGTDVYAEKVNEYCLFLQKKWQEFYETYTKEELIPVIKDLKVRQDDTNIKRCENGRTMLQPDDNGVRIRKLKRTELLHVKRIIGSCHDQFYCAWAVENSASEAKFREYIKTQKDTCFKLLWHGSGNENWWSIINHGLTTDPQNVLIEGKMFGNGIYFAENVEKSYAFSSIKMANKRKRFSNTSFLGLYEVAYGIPYDVYEYEASFAAFDYEKLQNRKKGADCLHAHRGEMLKNDEIVIYKDEQATIRYLVELRELDGDGSIQSHSEPEIVAGDDGGFKE